ncbi:MAG: N-acetyltransferase [Prevotella sp.]|nr:N-acetyltransferase [Prevotella sp.]
MNIRLEKPEDYREVENLTREAFWNVYAPGCVEHYVLNQYRSNPDFIKELDFVMESPLPTSPRGGEESKPRIIGHIMFSKAEILTDSLPSGRLEGATFGPISIHPDYKRKGYGLKLLQYALEEARKMGIGFICMEGNIDFYKHAGFVVASSLGIHYHAEPKDAEVPYFLAQELIPGYLNGIEGTYHTPKGYYVAFENKDAFEAYEATFPPKEKIHHEGQLVDDCTNNPNDRQ